MRLVEGEFVIAEPQLMRLGTRVADLILAVCRELGLNMASCLYALWVFHANSLVIGFRKMDRFLFGCASVLLGTKLG